MLPIYLYGEIFGLAKGERLSHLLLFLLLNGHWRTDSDSGCIIFLRYPVWFGAGSLQGFLSPRLLSQIVITVSLLIVIKRLP